MHRDANVSVLRNERNRGFTATANRGIAEAGRADVVLLNADTEVGPNWLTGLRRAAASADDVATVTAVSDNAGAFSVPELERENAMPAAGRSSETARALWHDAGRAYPALPTGNGFCMYIRRAVIDAVGALDEAAFPQGYGEENDFCQRASARGLRHLIAGNVYVRHARSASFGHERRAAARRSRHGRVARALAELRSRCRRDAAFVRASRARLARAAHVRDGRQRDAASARLAQAMLARYRRGGCRAWRRRRVAARRSRRGIARSHAEARRDATSLDERSLVLAAAYAIDVVIAASDARASCRVSRCARHSVSHRRTRRRCETRR